MVNKFITSPARALKDRRITSKDRDVLSYLCLRANNTTKESFPGQQRIADDLGICTRTLIRSLKRLEETGYIAVKHRYKKIKGGKTTNLYRVIFDTEDDWFELQEAQESEENGGCQLSDNSVTYQNQLSDTDVTNACDTDVTYLSNIDITRLNTNLTKIKNTKKGNLEEEFEKYFWPIYPKSGRKEKPEARKAFIAARQQASLETIMEGVKIYAEKHKDNPQYVKYAHRWLKGERWEDEYESHNGDQPAIDRSTEFCSCGKHNGIGAFTPLDRAESYAWNRRNNKNYNSEIQRYLESYEVAHGKVYDKHDPSRPASA